MLRAKAVCLLLCLSSGLCVAQTAQIPMDSVGEHVLLASNAAEAVESPVVAESSLGYSSSLASSNLAGSPSLASSKASLTTSGGGKVVVSSTAPVGTVLRTDKFDKPFSAIALAVKTTSLGAGIEVATPLARTLNLRGSANFFDFSYNFGVDGANYDGEFHFRSGQVGLDWFPFHNGFHITPGVLIFKTQLFALASVPAGGVFDLGDTTFTNSVTDPVHGGASLNFSRTIMPSLMIGVGNLIPRSGRHWSVPFEVGAAYMGPNTVSLNLSGTACLQFGCMSTSDPTIQQSVIQEQAILNEDLKRLQVYPIVSIGFGYRF